MKPILSSALSVAAALGLAGTAAAGTITFDRNGAAAGGQIVADTFDWTPDNVLFKNLVTSVITQVGPVKALNSSINSGFDLFGQGKLGNFISLSNANTGVAGCAAAGDYCAPLAGEFTYEFGLSMALTQPTTTVGTTTGFAAGIAGSGTNFFSIYYHPTATSNQLAGTGYGGGTKILAGSFADGSLDFSLNQAGSQLMKLDNQGADNYATLGTYLGNGSFQFDIAVASQDSAFFKTVLTNLALGMNLTSTLATPFSQANPARRVVGNTPNFGTDTKTGVFRSNASGNTTSQTRRMNDFSCLNAPGSSTAPTTSTCDFQAQSDGVSAFFNPVPEPATLGLMSAGMILAGVQRRGRRRSAR